MDARQRDELQALLVATRSNVLSFLNGYPSYQRSQGTSRNLRLACGAFCIQPAFGKSLTRTFLILTFHIERTTQAHD